MSENTHVGNALTGPEDTDNVDPERFAIELRTALKAMLRGDFSVRLDERQFGITGEITAVFNEVNETLAMKSDMLNDLKVAVVDDGRFGARMEKGGTRGAWRRDVESINSLVEGMVQPVSEIERVVSAVAMGDLTQRMQVGGNQSFQGGYRDISRVINTMVDQFIGFSSEVTRVAREVGTDGVLGGQAGVPGVSGVWRDITDNVNVMASNLTTQVRGIAEVASSVAQGDLSRKVQLEASGEVADLATTINTMVDALSLFAQQVTNVAREVGTEGVLGGQADVPNAEGIWRDLTDNVNIMAGNLTTQVRGIAEVVSSVANGDLSQKIELEARGEVARLATTINTMVDTLSIFADQVTNVAREVGTEGVLGGQAEVPKAEGIWRDLTVNVNVMANNLTTQVRGIADVVSAVAGGDLSRKIELEARGEVQNLATTINTMVDTLSLFAEQVTNVAREVGTEGVLGGQAEVPKAEGIWRDLTDNVNFMADNLTTQVRKIAEVATAVAEGDLSRKIEVVAKGEISELRETINHLVDQLTAFSGEVNRVAREVGTEGVLGGQADVPGVSGVWRDLTDNVNLMAANLTTQVRGIAEVVSSVATGDLSRKIELDASGEVKKLASTINTMVDTLSLFAEQVTNVAREVGTDGVLGGQAAVPKSQGIWRDLTDNVNVMASNLTTQVRGIANVVAAVASGDLSQKIELDAHGEVKELAATINTMVDTLSLFAQQVTNVAREVGTEGVLGGQAEVPKAEGIWRDLTDNVNVMAANLTTQVRGIADIATSVAQGDLSRKIELESSGEVDQLATTINTMVDTLSLFADQVTYVAREVGTKGVLGGQAQVPNAEGIWKDLTSNVNTMASNLTSQVRSISDVATAVTHGDLARKIELEASGEVGVLANKINTMIDNLASTTLDNKNNTWIQTGVSEFNDVTRGEKDLDVLATEILSQLCRYLQASVGCLYIKSVSAEDSGYYLTSTYAVSRDILQDVIYSADGIVGQVIKEKNIRIIKGAPDHNLKIKSSLIDYQPAAVLLLPFCFQGEVIGVIEIGTDQYPGHIELELVQQLTEHIAISVASAQSRVQLNAALDESRALADLLQRQQDKMQLTNNALEEKTEELVTAQHETEERNRQLEKVQQDLNDRAKQLATSSKYKSEFLANMSHELRTPLNSILLLSNILATENNSLEGREKSNRAQVIHDAGTDLLHLINEILDLSKIEAGKMSKELAELNVSVFVSQLKDVFEPVAIQKGIELNFKVNEVLKDIRILTDSNRLQQVIRNFMSNAIKFTEQGSVIFELDYLSLEGVDRYNTCGDRVLKMRHAPEKYIELSVTDTGIGIARNQFEAVFEAFRQADGTIGRIHGGTGLGLSISRQIADLLEGGIFVKSEPGSGSTFSIAVPISAETQGSSAERTAKIQREQALQAEVYTTHDHSSGDQRYFLENAPTVLVATKDSTVAQVLIASVKEFGMVAIHANTGPEAIRLAHKYVPTLILLDIDMPIVDGWYVLYYMKHHNLTRHIPVHVVCDSSEDKRAMKAGAESSTQKPFDKSGEEQWLQFLQRYIHDSMLQETTAKKQLMIVEGDSKQRKEMEVLLTGIDIKITSSNSAEDALKQFKKNKFDCLVMNLSLPDMNGIEFIDAIRGDKALSDLPVVVYTEKVINSEQQLYLGYSAQDLIFKTADSPRTLLESTSIFLGRNYQNMRADQQEILSEKEIDSLSLNARKILIVDDDIRNIYATSSLLELNGATIISAGNGEEALTAISDNPDIDLILMDIMMPVMDGYEAMQNIRRNERLNYLPVIALTAKALPEDLQRCMDCGASDYLTKPIDTEELFRMIKLWLSIKYTKRDKADNKNQVEVDTRI